MGTHTNRYTGYIYCAGLNKDGGYCSRPVKKEGDLCFQHQPHSVPAEAALKEGENRG